MHANPKFKLRLDFTHKSPQYQEFSIEFTDQQEHSFFLNKFSYLQE